KQLRPDWCEKLPQLCDALLALDDREVAALGQCGDRLAEWLASYLPDLQPLSGLTTLPAIATAQLTDQGPHFNVGIPGRKWQQIERFASALGQVELPLLEWCGGKGHLGRLLGAQWQVAVETIEHDGALCEEGSHYAERAGVAQRFQKVDALSAEAQRFMAGRHAVALHACGELHRTLLRGAVEANNRAFDFVPCCYYLGAGERYRPFNQGLDLELTRDDLRLAVTETVTAAGREVAKRDQEMAWKLGYDLLRREQCGEKGYLPIKPINKSWLQLGFEGFCRELAQREGRVVPQGIEWQRFEEGGWQRQREVMRYSLVRAAFRRALEMWLVLDMASYIELQGYEVNVGTFCERELTPRNILISARRSQAV
ncbi:MAG: SAM-dependent methyltransferase, partial [Chromatiales bacterium]|nr:SAM-dependent methyltransferase [Chromatiales bacterium]